MRADAVGIAIRRSGEFTHQVQVAAWRCRNCGERSFSEDVVERALETLEEHTEPGDEIVILDEGSAAGSA
ncbi:MAG TPA: hypothetical protein VHL31_14165 [Geminicoccus sp.]|uniref:hypothetical protein n=1 Tax=Geminicoccus sp. TaxID=2024832 RepID=UPI002E2F4736|nr:hypothetical protein [Geminicoccus sp.]HEX2527428.1 hypothetical protein [Geminicoccus sp.]